jgi:hypothetical protein
MTANVSIHFDEDNAAFEDPRERGRIIDEAFEFARDVIEEGVPQNGAREKSLRDINGNTVGSVRVGR